MKRFLLVSLIVLFVVGAFVAGSEFRERGWIEKIKKDYFSSTTATKIKNFSDFNTVVTKSADGYCLTTFRTGLISGFGEEFGKVKGEYRVSYSKGEIYGEIWLGSSWGMGCIYIPISKQ